MKRIFFKSILFGFAVSAGLCLSAQKTQAGYFDYSDVLLVINDASADSVAIGNYYKTARGIPDSQVVHISTVTTETVSRTEFTNNIRTPIENFLTTNDLTDTINYIVLTKGTPIRFTDTTDSVDADVALVLGAYSAHIGGTNGFSNPYYNKNVPFSKSTHGYYIVTRLTGYSVADVEALIDRSANAVTTNAGKFVLDVDPTRDNPSYRSGNDWMRSANTILSGKGYETLLNETTTYVTGQTDVLGYYSWGSNDANDLDNGKPGNTYVNGAIAETIVSTSARTFTSPPSYGQSLIADLIAEGVSGVKGYVAEPYLSAVAHADILFDRYTSGFNMADSFYAASSQLGWKDLVVGDPKMIAAKIPQPLTLSAPANNAISDSQSPTFSWTEPLSYHGIAKYQLYIDGVLDKDDISGTSTTPSAILAAGLHTWYVKVIDGNGGSAVTSSRTINIIPGYASPYSFHVDNVLGNDSNPGTEALPWATLAKATSTVSDGDTVIIRKNAGSPYRESLVATYGASEEDRITFRGTDAEHKPEIWGSDDVSSGWSTYAGGNADTYERSLSVDPGTLATGPAVENLTNRIEGASAATLDPGEWAWESDMLYYRLAEGESMSSFHAEAGVRTGISGGAYRTYQDIIVRYADAGVVLGGNSIGNRLEVYDTASGMTLSSSGATMFSCIVDGAVDGVMIFGNSHDIVNSVIVNSSSAALAAFVVANNATVRNNILAGNGTIFEAELISPMTGFSASHNNWEGSWDAEWETRKGTDNRENLSPYFSDFSGRDFSLQYLSPNIDAGTAVSGRTTDALGNPLYGNPDIGAYEYQPPYVMGTDEIDISGDIRIYGDGKFRNTAASSGTTADFSVVPSGGFGSGDYGEWMDITVSTWSTSGAYVKNWTEESDTLGSTATAHTIGDLEADTYYAVSVDGSGSGLSGTGCGTSGSDFVCASDAGGRIAFTYSGGYAVTRTFEVVPFLGADTESVTIAISTAEPSTCKYSAVSTDPFDSMSSFSTTGSSTHSTIVEGLSSGSYSYHILCRDADGDDTASTFAFKIPPEERAESIRTETKIDQKTKTVRGSTVYSSEGEIGLRGSDDSLSGGTVKIWVDDKHWKTLEVDGDGSWSKTLDLKPGKTVTLKIRYYDRYGTHLDTERFKVKTDIEDPVFVRPLPEKMIVRRTERISFPATDAGVGIDSYRVKLSGARSWRTQKDDFYIVPEAVPDGSYELLVRAYDKAGNYAEQKSSAKIVRFGNGGVAPLVLSPDVVDERASDTQPDIVETEGQGTDTGLGDGEQISVSPEPRMDPPSDPSSRGFVWWNPFTWF